MACLQFYFFSKKNKFSSVSQWDAQHIEHTITKNKCEIDMYHMWLNIYLNDDWVYRRSDWIHIRWDGIYISWMNVNEMRLNTNTNKTTEYKYDITEHIS